MIKIRNLYKSYGDEQVLKGIDLELFDGELVVIVGASGSGKSVLLRCMGRKEKWDRGKLIYKRRRHESDKFFSSVENEQRLGRT